MRPSTESSADKSSALQIELAQELDVDELEELVNLAYRGGKASVSWKNEHHLVQGPRISKADLKHYISEKDSAIYLCRNESRRILGAVHIEKHADQAHIGMLSVDPDYQNYGIGKKLLLFAGDFAREKLNCREAKMFVFAGREELLAWYQKMGYEATGETMPFFGPESGLRALVENAHFVVVRKNLA
ncbi:MAG: GNAT family N-acetyltransferase [Candidatus Obscuribacterales bacterium]|nr:GNAT family N-acetyltransferase [Candidatus Obscuribacterales bacterium]